MVGEVVSHYRILELLEPGGMGVVYRARDLMLERDVALKLLPLDRAGDPDARASLLHEGRIASRLSRSTICTVHELGEHDGKVFIAMELLPGSSVAKLLATGALPLHRVLAIGADVADALAEAHRHNVVHRDLKGGNVMVGPEGHAKVLDFGLAKSTAPLGSPDHLSPGPLTVSGTLVGTPHYWAPEILRGGKADAKSDLWSLGILLYEMSTGRRPFQGATMVALGYEILNLPPAPLPESFPPGLRMIILRCLDKEPSRRYRSAEEVKAALEALQYAHPKPHRRPRYALGVAAAVVAMLVDTRAPVSRSALVPLDISRASVSSFPPAPPVPAVTADAQLFVGPIGHEPHRLLPGSRVAVGDQLHLTIQSPERTHVYVLDGDANGEIFVLYPVLGSEPQNPLPANKVQRLPAGQNWVVTSEGGRETILVVASREPLPQLERAIHGVPRAQAGGPPTYSRVSVDTLLALQGAKPTSATPVPPGVGGMTRPRGIGAMTQGSNEASIHTLGDLRGQLESLAKDQPDLWVWSIDLENGGR